MYPKTAECAFSLSIVMPLLIFQGQKSTKRDIWKYQLSKQLEETTSNSFMYSLKTMEILSLSYCSLCSKHLVIF